MYKKKLCQGKPCFFFNYLQNLYSLWTSTFVKSQNRANTSHLGKLFSRISSTIQVEPYICVLYIYTVEYRYKVVKTRIAFSLKYFNSGYSFENNRYVDGFRFDSTLYRGFWVLTGYRQFNILIRPWRRNKTCIVLTNLLYPCF